MTDINKELREALRPHIVATDRIIDGKAIPNIDLAIAKIKALVVEELIKEIELIDDKLYDLNKSDWGIPTKWSNEKYKGENYADLWTPNEAIHELIRGRLGEIRTIYQ
jgi:hypothetical protein